MKKILPEIRPRHRTLWRLIAKNRFRLYAAMFASLMVAVTNGAMAYLIKPVVDDIFMNKDIHSLWVISLAIGVVGVVRGLGYFGQEYFMYFVGHKIIKNVRDLLYGRILDLPISFFQAEKTGGLMSRVTWDVNLIREMVSRTVTGSMRDFFSIIFLTGVILYMNWKLALIAILILPIAYYPVMYFGKKVRRWSTVSQEAMGDISSFLHETFAGNKVVKAFGMEGYEKERFEGRTQELFELEMKAAVARCASSPIMEFLGAVGAGVIIIIGGLSVIRGDSSPGSFFSFLAAVIMLYDPIKKLSHMNNALQEGMAAADRIFDIVEREPDIREPENPKPIEKKPHIVAFNNVGFAYEQGAPVLTGVNVTVSPGEVVALVGASGGGKTSLVNLIPRFFDVTSGAVTIDGIDIRDFAVADLRGEIAVVTQEPILFNDTVRNNIAYGNRSATDEQIEQAARAAFAHDFILKFEKGYESNIGELGSKLSGGEKQRLCIARALIKDTPVLVLDEATSSLDTEAERIVQKALENLMAGRTSFVIAHRLSTVRHADRILVIENGRVVEEGKHDDLLKKPGAYARLHEMQFQGPAT